MWSFQAPHTPWRLLGECQRTGGVQRGRQPHPPFTLARALEPLQMECSGEEKKKVWFHLHCDVRRKSVLMGRHSGFRGGGQCHLAGPDWVWSPRSWRGFVLSLTPHTWIHLVHTQEEGDDLLSVPWISPSVLSKLSRRITFAITS